MKKDSLWITNVYLRGQLGITLENYLEISNLEIKIGGFKFEVQQADGNIRRH